MVDGGAQQLFSFPDRRHSVFSEVYLGVNPSLLPILRRLDNKRIAKVSQTHLL
jgi:hypothetical protein